MLLWLDLETTGLNPTTDHILEVSYLATSQDTFTFYNPRQDKIIDNDFSALIENHLIEPNFATLQQIEEDQFINDMHTKTGLLDDLKFEQTTILKSAEYHILEHIANARDQLDDHGALYLAGASVHFDLAFIRHHMPTLASKLSHRVYDTSTLKAFFDGLLDYEIPNLNPHRATYDVMECLAVANLLRTKTKNLIDFHRLIAETAERV